MMIGLSNAQCLTLFQRTVLLQLSKKAEPPVPRGIALPSNGQPGTSGGGETVEDVRLEGSNAHSERRSATARQVASHIMATLLVKRSFIKHSHFGPETDQMESGGREDERNFASNPHRRKRSCYIENIDKSWANNFLYRTRYAREAYTCTPRC